MIFSLLALVSAISSSLPLRTIDSSTARKVLERAGSVVSPSGVNDWQVLGPLPGDTAVVLRQGTEIARVAWDPLLDPAKPTVLPVVDDSGWGSRVKRWTAPASGIQLSSSLTSAIATGSNPITMNTIDADVRLGWKGWVSVGGLARFERLIATPPIAIPLGDSIVRPVVDWGLSACGPVLCLEGRTRTLPVGPESWLQPRLSDELVARRRGEFWRTSGDSAFEGSWETRLSAHAGILHYSTSWCPGLWNGSIQSLGIRARQASGAAWGGGVLWTTERMASWVELGFAGIPLPWVRIRKEPILWNPIAGRIEWRSFRQFSVTLQTVLTLPDPLPFASPKAPSP